LHMYIENEVTGFPYVMLQVVLVLCSIWSLDFFHSVIPPFCVSSSIKTIHALALEYLVAFYPICLISITYLCINLHYNNFRPIVWLWKPLHRHFVHFRKKWDTKVSMVNVFTTFILFSFSKILFVTFTLLYTMHIRYNSHTKSRIVLYYDPTVEYRTQEYDIFAAIGGCVLAIFVVLPTILLIVYPTRLFQKVVSSCGFRRWNALHMFVESFQGQYKDGTNGTCDFRMVSASSLILRTLILYTYTFDHYLLPMMLLQCGLLMGAFSFHAIVRPYKASYSNNVDILILALLWYFLSLTFVLVVCYSDKITVTFIVFAVGLSLLLCVPHMVLMFYVFYKLAEMTGMTQCLKLKYAHMKEWILSARQISQAKAIAETTSDIESLPDRLLNPGAYEPLLPNTNVYRQ